MVIQSSLLHGWAILVAVLVLSGAVGVGYLLRRRREPSHPKWIANASYILGLYSVREALLRYRVAVGIATGLAVMAGVSASVVAARPVDTVVEYPRLANRDIVLCLDVSGSMLGYDAEIVDRFTELVQGFAGERIALSIWNQTSRTVFPLTDDYTLVTEELIAAKDATDVDYDDAYNGTWSQSDENKYVSFTAGTMLDFDAEQGSLIGDGLASCALLFDGADTTRSRSIILASDNEVFGTPLFELDEAADVVAERDISLVGVFGGDKFWGDAKGFEETVAKHDGLFFEASDPGAVPAILDKISSEQAAELNAVGEVHVTDLPGAAVVWVFIGLLGLSGLAWWVRE